jgi:hypothetical protein
VPHSEFDPGDFHSGHVGLKQTVERLLRTQLLLLKVDGEAHTPSGRLGRAFSVLSESVFRRQPT